MQTQVTNPLMIMAINMFIVFSVLIALWVLMLVIKAIDPTRVKKAKAEAEPKPAAAPAPTAAPAVASQSNQDEVIAAITAAITAMGYSSTQIATVRPSISKKWTYEGRLTGRM